MGGTGGGTGIGSLPGRIQEEPVSESGGSVNLWPGCRAGHTGIPLCVEVMYRAVPLADMQ